MPLTTNAPLVLQEMVRRGLLGIQPGLSRMEAVCAALGHPEAQLGEVVHVAGTNGKGSVCAFLEATMRRSGRSTGLFTSPHLVDICERVRLNGLDISPQDFDLATIKVLAAERTCSVTLTGFELVTAAGFVAMAHHRPDVSIIEVGMGGRLDATNVVRPAVAVLTPIAMDHASYLGADVATIAGEKVGIVKAGVPCFSAVQLPEVREVIRSRCAALPAPLSEAEVSFHATGGDGLWRGEFGPLKLGPIALALKGDFQQGNAALAMAAARQLLGTELTPKLAAAGLSTARWPGRFQLSEFKGRPLLLDGAHNPHAMTELCSSFRARYNHRPDVLLAVKEDKDVAQMTATLAGLVRWAVCTTTGSVASVPPAHLARLLKECPTAVEPDPEAALDLLVAREGNNVALCCGSFYLIGALLKRLSTVTENNS